MGTTGGAYDNAMAESFFATLEVEVLQRRLFKTQAEARMALFEYIEGCTTRICATHPSALVTRELRGETQQHTDAANMRCNL